MALVGHAYRANPRRARLVRADDALCEVGDEALVAARALGPAGVCVVVAPKRSEAVSFAARHADVLVLDGVAQTAPVRAALALLAVDADEPWGRGEAVAPMGDLRAPKSALLRACDRVVPIADGAEVRAESARRSDGAFGAWRCEAASRGVWVGETLRTWEDIAGLRLGLVCAIARPDRLIRFLAKRGVSLRAQIRARDHGPVSASAFARALRTTQPHSGIDLWLATQKCFLHFAQLMQERDGVGNVLHAPVAAIEHTLVLAPALLRRLDFLAAP